MSEPAGTAEIESAAGDIAVAADATATAGSGAAEDDLDGAARADAGGVADDGSAEMRAGDEEADDETKAPEPPRRRLVAELLEGQDFVDESPTAGSQLVAPPLHLQTVDEGQPIYQLDLSSEEPQGVIVTPEPYETRRKSAIAGDRRTYSDPYHSAAGVDLDALQAIKQMIVHRERRVMAAERDGIGAYQLAIELEGFVRALLDAVRRADS